MTAKPLDIRIIGGGLAGCITGLTLLERVPNARLTVYEREAEPYTTLCGEGLSHHTLERFTAFDWRPYVAETFAGAAWFFPGGVRFDIDERCYTMARETWIPAMARALEERGAKYLTNERVDAERLRALAREADVVVGADGPGGASRKVVGGTHETLLGLQYRVERAGFESDRLLFYTDKRWSPEYAWIFPRGDILNVGLLSDTSVKTDENWARLDRFMDAYEVRGKVLKREAYPIGFSGTKVQADADRARESGASRQSSAGLRGERPRAGPNAVRDRAGNIVLIGDAAGLTNPVTKGGMAAVVYAAEILASCLADGKLDEYERRIFAHPITDPSFAKAVGYIRAWTNRDFEKLARFAPKRIVVRDGGPSARRRYLPRIAATVVANPGKAGALHTIYNAMAISRRYSW
ncbi:MAG: NAD(P)/FAD-dependent oxidoreductase [Thermoplasmatota archaeon]